MTAQATLARGTVRVVLAALLVGGFVWNTALLQVLATEWHMNDFGKFYYATTAWLSGGDLYAPTIASVLPAEPLKDLQLLNMNPPHFHLLMLPFAWLSPDVALQAWVTLSLFALGLALALVARELGCRWSVDGAMGVAAASLLFSATQGFFGTGQVSLLLVLPLTTAWLLARRARWGAAGLAIGLCAALKPFLLIFLPYFFVTRRYRALGASLCAVASSFGAGVAVFGIEAHRSWIVALGKSDQWTWFPMGISANAFLTRLFTPTASYVPVWQAPSLVAAATGVALLVGLATFVGVARDSSPRRVDHAFALLLVASQIMSPLGWVYYLWLPVGPLAAIASDLWRQRGQPIWATFGSWNWVWALALLAFFVPSPITLQGQPSALATVTIGSVYFWATLALWGLLLRQTALTTRIAT